MFGGSGCVGCRWVDVVFCFIRGEMNCGLLVICSMLVVVLGICFYLKCGCVLFMILVWCGCMVIGVIGWLWMMKLCLLFRFFMLLVLIVCSSMCRVFVGRLLKVVVVVGLFCVVSSMLGWLVCMILMW